MKQLATSTQACEALQMLSSAQDSFVKQLTKLCQTHSLPEQFKAQQWLRDNGTHGGGVRFEAPENSLFNRASVNVSQIQFEDTPEKAFISATALSTIIHPNNPLAPSVHIHVSWTELRSGKSYWRLMADLNPALNNEQDTASFDETLQALSGQYYEDGKQQGNEYFYIPTLKTHRGVSHFYLEGFNPDGQDGLHFANTFVNGVIDSYVAILSNRLSKQTTYGETELQQQCDYHTLYFYQVLTLDKGTTAGLLVHDQNDIGTLGSLPRYINRQLLKQWAKSTPVPRDQLVNALVKALPEKYPSEISSKVKSELAAVIRLHYQTYPL